ncbi:hypothetical protein RF11_02686 [Thelohanellus kitauei]|uniref:Uncharacterized protein n=1 Tax=Thelohanellus kitauei TaxID=669202 RepID=A0A0C2MUB0_THEKT|nr:hypothetical protein RF11_02686 [Thelohanellus kitauei]
MFNQLIYLFLNCEEPLATHAISGFIFDTECIQMLVSSKKCTGKFKPKIKELLDLIVKDLLAYIDLGDDDTLLPRSSQDSQIDPDIDVIDKSSGTPGLIQFTKKTRKITLSKSSGFLLPILLIKEIFPLPLNKNFTAWL